MAQQETARRAEIAEKLREHFLDISTESQSQVNGWRSLWEAKLTPWDRGRPNPAFVDFLNDKPELSADPFRDADCKVRKKALVPGCGRGVDVLLLASHGFDAYGVDASDDAVEAAENLQAAQQLSSSFEDSTDYPLRNDAAGRGAAKVFEADFFEDDLAAQTHGPADADVDADADQERGFDLIYDYTFLCALPAPLRPKWAKRMAQLLAKDGKLVCLEYPLDKPPSTGGPPYGLSEKVYEQLFRRPGEELEYDADGNVVEKTDQTESEDALVRIERLTPKRTFADPGTVISERISIWQHIQR